MVLNPRLFTAFLSLLMKKRQELFIACEYCFLNGNCNLIHVEVICASQIRDSITFCSSSSLQSKVEGRAPTLVFRTSRVSPASESDRNWGRAGKRERGFSFPLPMLRAFCQYLKWVLVFQLQHPLRPHSCPVFDQWSALSDTRVVT